MAERKKIYGFNEQRGKTLNAVADAWVNTPQFGGGGGLPSVRFNNKFWIVETQETMTAATWSTVWDAGEGEVELMDVSTGRLTGRNVLRDALSFWPYAVPSGHLLAAVVPLTSSNHLVAVEWLTKPHLFCRFTAGAAFTTSSSSVSGTIQSYMGFGNDHASSSATFNNLAISSNYLFEGDSGDAGLAYYTGSGTTWQIVQMECP